jgi:multiple RNA-binding domain-containing protein 1
MDYLKGKVTSNFSSDDDDDNDDGNDNDNGGENDDNDRSEKIDVERPLRKEIDQLEKDVDNSDGDVASDDEIDDSGRLFIRNLPFTCSEEELRERFSQFGELTEVHIPLDSAASRARGFAFVHFLFPEHAAAARAAVDRRW